MPKMKRFQQYDDIEDIYSLKVTKLTVFKISHYLEYQILTFYISDL